MSKNRSISSSQQSPNFQSSFDGNKLVFNFDVLDSLGLPSGVGVGINRSFVGADQAEFVWHEGYVAETNAVNLESLSFTSLSSWTTDDRVTLSKLNISAPNMISGTYNANNDHLNVGLNGEHLSFDSHTIQSRSSSAVTNTKFEDLAVGTPIDRRTINGSLYLNPYGGNVYLGDLWNDDLLNKCFEIRGDARHINLNGGTVNLTSDVDDINLTALNQLNLNGDVVNVTHTNGFKVNGANVPTIYRQASEPMNASNNDLWIDAVGNLHYWNGTSNEWIDLFDFGTYTG